MKKFLFIACLIFISSTAMYSNAPFCNLSLEDKVCQLEELQAEAATDQVMSLLEIMDESDKKMLVEHYTHLLENLNMEQLSVLFNTEMESMMCGWVHVGYEYDNCYQGRPDCSDTMTQQKFKKERFKCGSYWGSTRRGASVGWVCGC